VTRKATSEYAVNPVITREDVLQSIGTDVEDLFPARSLIETPAPLVVREQLPSLVREILIACGAVILEADGGVGKTVIAAHLGSGLPAGSASFVYDCFGNGAYRSSSGYRHRARDGLVQLANEMATAALCDPLIPTPKADAAAYVRAFIGRLHQTSTVLAARAPDAVLMIVIDAADNAQMAADEAQDGPSFPRLLLRETFPSNVRLVFTTRPHRTHLLNPPPDIPRIQLLAFTEAETSTHVHGRFPNASIQDVREFHRLTSQNPRVQRAALDAGTSISGVLAALGPTPRSVDDTIGALLEAAIATVRDSAASVEQPQIDRVCTALATLRPFVPLDIVATTAGVPVELVRSIAHDLRRPLLIRDDAVQFRDEPTETWFREHYRPQPNELRSFIECLRPLATTSAYVAATLPPLMLEAGDFDALVQLALSGEGLPTQNAISRRDVELQRLQFALKAALRSRRFSEAAKLALKAGGEAAADARQQTLLSNNTDLASRFLDVHQLLEQVSRRLVVGGSWTGSEHAYEAALLSGNQALAGDARSRLRLAYDWVNHWGRARAHDETSRERMEDADIAELQLAELNLHGVDVCAKQLRHWRPREVSFRVGKLLIGRLVDASRIEEIDALCIAAGNDLGLLLAAMVKLREVGRVPPKAAVKRAATLVLSRHVVLEAPGDWRGEERRLEAINALVLAARYYGVGSKRDLARLLTKYLPKDPPGDFYSRHFHDSRFVYLRAYTLRAALQNRLPSIESLAHPEIRKAVTDKNWHNTDASRFREHIGALLPWHTLGIEVLLGKVPHQDIEAKIEAARQAAKAAEGHPAYGEPSPTANEIARIWCELIVGSTTPAALWPAFTAWQSQLKQPLSIPTLAALARQAAHGDGQQTMALDLAHRVFQLAQQTGETAESQADTYVTLARAVLPASNDEAQRYFEETILVSSRIGEEHLDRWSALLDLADASADERRDEPKAAYRLARAAELIYTYVARDKYFDWEHTVEALAGLSARSALTILSRWNDRRFGWNSRLLPALVSALLKRSALDARDALPLVGFEARWDYPGLLTDALDRAIDGKERHTLAAYAFYYLRFAELSVEDWRGVHTLFQSCEFDDLDVGPMLDRAERAAAERSPKRPETTASVEKEVVDWDGVFAGLDLGAAGDLQAALARYRDLSPPLRNNDLLREAMSRIAGGQERAFIEAFAATTPDLYDLRGLLESLPADWNARVAVRPALVLLTKETYRRCARSVSMRRYWQPLPFELVARTTGLSTVVLIREAVDALGIEPRYV